MRRLGIRRRLALALTILALLVAGSAALALVAHDGLHAELDAIADSERSLRASLELSVAVRDMYAHQAHTIILDDRSHVAHYQPTVREAKALLLALEGFLHDDPLAHELPAIGQALDAIDRGFRDDILPHIGQGQRAALVAPHDRALARVDDITRAIGRIAAVIGQRSEDARARTDRARAEEQVVHLTLVLLAVALAIVTGVQLARAVAGPLEALRRGAQRLATGDLQTRVAPVRADEIGEVALAFNAMAADLAAHEQRLVQSETLASVGRLAAGVAHEVANPLAVIIGYARLLERHADGAVVADARRIGLEAERCQAIVQGLLDLARPPRLSRVPVDLAEVVADVGASLAAAGLDARVAVTGAATVSADAKKLRQIVWNLLRNAAEAAPGAPIDVRLEAGAGVARLHVEDRGPGVADDMLPRLFEPFASSKGGGTGLGLAVSAALARAHGGTLTHAGRAASGGAAFVLELPLC